MRNFWKYLTRVHRWAGLVLGVQITLWFASGFFMSFFDINTVRGRHIAEKQDAVLTVEADMIAPQTLFHEGELHSVSLRAVLGEPLYVLSGDAGEDYIHARTGEPWKALGETSIRLAAQTYYKGEGEIASTRKLDIAPIEYRGPLPVWQVTFNDGPATRLYLDPNTAELKSVRTRLWRAFDFMWMLHIMDYKGRDNINTWWLKLFSGAALLFAFSGVALVVQRVFLRPKA